MGASPYGAQVGHVHETSPTYLTRAPSVLAGAFQLLIHSFNKAEVNRWLVGRYNWGKFLNLSFYNYRGLMHPRKRIFVPYSLITTMELRIFLVDPPRSQLLTASTSPPA